MDVSALLQEQSIIIPLDASDKSACMRALVDQLDAGGVLSDKAAYLEAVIKREETGSTGIGFGVAIPHGKSSGVKKPSLAFAKLSKPLDWQSLDGAPVSAVFMIAVPEEAAANEHLKILIGISRKLIDEDFRNQLLAVEEPKQLISLLQTI